MTHPALPAELEIFKKDVGTWDATIEIRMKPGADAMISKGVSTSRLECGGRWLVTDFQNEMGFGGHGVYGFDVAQKRYTGVWVDPTRTSLNVMEGTYDSATRTMTFKGSHKNADGTIYAWRETTETVDPDTQIWRSFMPSPDGEFEMMTVTYRRRPS